VLELNAAMGILHQGFRPYILGFQLNDDMKNQGAVDLGMVLHHATILARLLKVKVPSSARKVKPKNTPTYLLTEMGSATTDTINAVLAAIQPASIEKKEVVGKNKEGTPTKKEVTVITPSDLDTEKVSEPLSRLLSSLYEFHWALYQAPVADLMEAHIKRLVPGFPKGFFDPPAKKASNLPVKAKAAKPAKVAKIAAAKPAKVKAPAKLKAGAVIKS
jgi:hypothetical protein